MAPQLTTFFQVQEAKMDLSTQPSKKKFMLRAKNIRDKWNNCEATTTYLYLQKPLKIAETGSKNQKEFDNYKSYRIKCT